MHLHETPLVDASETGLTSTPIQQAMALAREHGPIFRRRFHERESVLVSSYALVDELSDETRFTKAVGPALEHVRDITADGLFTAYNDEPNWAKAHDILLPAFALGSMRTYHPTMLRVCRRLVASWDAALARGTSVDVSADMTRMTLDTIGLAGFGYDFESFRRPEPHPFVQALVRALAHSQAALSRTPGGDYAAEDRAFAADAAFLAEVVDEVIGARKAAAGEEAGASPDDLLGLMLDAPHPADGRPLDEANIRNQVITFLIAGHETTSGTLSFALHHLLKNPAALRLAQAEVDALWGDEPDPDPSFEDIGGLRYVRQVLNETLRLWPTAAAFERAARHDTVIGGNFPVRAGQRLTVLTPMLHRDLVWGDNVEEFDPDRFAPDAEAARPANAYKPFGTGERACIGRQFALHEATMLLALLIHRYRFLGRPGHTLTVKETLTLKPEGFTLTLAARTGEDRARVRGAARGGSPAGAPAGEPPGTELPARAIPGSALTVLHGSDFGTCRGYAEDLAGFCGSLGFRTTVAPLDAYAGGPPADVPVVIVAASYNGRPTDDAAAFFSWLADAEAGAADGLRYCVLGVGDRNWAATYQHVPTEIDRRLAELGGTRLLDRAEADASGDLAGAVARFTAGLRRTLLEAYGDPESAGVPDSASAAPEYSYDVTEVTGAPGTALAARHGVLPMTVAEARDLVDPSHPLGRPKRFVRLALPTGVTYRTADHLAVLPVNDPALVERAAKAFGVDPDALLDVRAHRPGRATLPLDRPVTAHELLSRHLELQAPVGPEQVARLAGLNPCPPERAALHALAADTAADPVCLIELVERNPALQGLLGWPLLLDLLPPIRPRHYSVSSSPTADPRHADLMVSLLSGPSRAGTGTFTGVGSAYLHRVRPGDEVYARVLPCREAFRVEHDARTPLIMIGAGTGLAPFRATIADRHALVRRGTLLAPALCYFGCDHPDVDYLHRTELEEADRSGAVSMRPAFSKSPELGGPFVQDRVTTEGAEVWRLLEAGARVYVCGDGRRMAPGVRGAFRGIYERFAGGGSGGSGGDEAGRWLDGLVGDGRYVEDVYAGG
ncbi:P450 reductase [Streptomyces eurocidicus]|uniref:Bifunctional cytochrome P450/NADPH--P450 reductase n=1 Tax=Streptomyces eurocidicus TaxID=66423 RepID=A0A2N8NXJ2_STREU|nr:cytochrome P450 [Streptomyces eurocidicus]MBB5120549.1 cytochrome P450/NADPH-cytochrome P450 reductase [Streptomyces eurocidicus]MBF6053760.1 cytochrome P450 [Streptomyces eurocidicus]PNE33493.1 P450 reductase [Streptomyces eurocidicus]